MNKRKIDPIATLNQIATLANNALKNDFNIDDMPTFMEIIRQLSENSLESVTEN